MQQFIGITSPFPILLFSQFASISFLLAIAVVVYIFFAYCLQRIAFKSRVSNTWRAYVPYLSEFLLYDVAGISYTWFLLSVIPLITTILAYIGGTDGVKLLVVISPFLKIISFANLALAVYIWMRISERLGKSMWLGFLMIVPIANIILPVYLAFSETTSTQSSKNSSTPLKGWKHPELLEGEVFLENYTTDDFQNKIHWQSKRLGKVPYTKIGQSIDQPNVFPVFVSREELRKAGLNMEQE
jgi:hypothetical protein